MSFSNYGHSTMTFRLQPSNYHLPPTIPQPLSTNYYLLNIIDLLWLLDHISNIIDILKSLNMSKPKQIWGLNKPINCNCIKIR